MTEYKRFKLDNFDSTREMLELLDTQRLIISDMEKENEQLKQENHDIKHKIEELYYTYIYEPSKNYDEEALGQITNLLFKDEMKD